MEEFAVAEDDDANVSFVVLVVSAVVVAESIELWPLILAFLLAAPAGCRI